MRVSRSRVRIAAVLTLLLLLAPVAVSAVTYAPQASTGSGVDVSGGGLNASTGGGDESAAPAETAGASATAEAAERTGTPRAGAASEEGRLMVNAVRPVRAAYGEYFTLAAWVLPLWVGELEFTLLNLAAVVLAFWAGTEARFWWRRRD